ncbi:uncharacterized protein LOC109713764 isoform X3 [Ananas comosus]|uniref:Uncharacterized protein LOC109713764 isoform X3 n=1 Tax=Ananas comosus TaxID=4615 RepID=A0A6P5FD61_ANACO|nr:uncharacterized protein LOC109713764 isoform X3 [Ananas comosus]
MVERFFSTSQPVDLSSIQSLTLLSGPPCCGKSSLLFQFAINCALGSDRDVVFICSKRKFENKPPFLSQNVDPSSDALQQIQMKYVEDDEGIKKYFAAFHLHESFPVAVIIDDFGDFFSERICQQRYANARGRDIAMVRTLALCQDAIAHANTWFITRNVFLPAGECKRRGRALFYSLIHTRATRLDCYSFISDG